MMSPTELSAWIATSRCIWFQRTRTPILCPRKYGNVLRLRSALVHAANFVPPRGPIFENRPTEKLEQYKRLCAAGIPTPRTERFEFGKHYDEKEWSEFVILKPLPLTLSSRKGWTRLYRTHRLEHLKAHDLPQDHFLRKGPGLVQTLIDTGSHPTKYRVLSLFGEALYSSMTRSVVPRVSLDASDEELEASVIDAKNPKSTPADTAGERNRLVDR